MNESLSTLIESAIRERIRRAKWPEVPPHSGSKPVRFDPERAPSLPPASEIIAQATKRWETDQSYGRSLRSAVSDLTFDALISFSRRVSCDLFESEMQESPIILARTETSPSAIVQIEQAEYSAPVRREDTFEVLYSFRIRLGR
jgi:hypothetical protein